MIVKLLMVALEWTGQSREIGHTRERYSILATMFLPNANQMMNSFSNCLAIHLLVTGYYLAYMPTLPLPHG